jgi:hypothetical protein
MTLELLLELDRLEREATFAEESDEPVHFAPGLFREILKLARRALQDESLKAERDRWECMWRDAESRATKAEAELTAVRSALCKLADVEIDTGETTLELVGLVERDKTHVCRERDAEREAHAKTRALLIELDIAGDLHERLSDKGSEWMRRREALLRGDT